MSSLPNVRKRVFQYTKVDNTGRVERVLKLIVYLSEFRSFDECANHLNVSKKTIGRMINQLHSIGFQFETNYGRYYATRITNIEQYFKGQN